MHAIFASIPKKDGRKDEMAEESERLLDATGWQLLRELQENGRLSFRELGQRVGLSPSSVAERVRHLEEAGILQGYHAEINLAKVGLPITAFVDMDIPPMQMSVAPGQTMAHISALLCEMPEVLECYRLTGREAFHMKVCASSVQHLAEFLDRLSQYGQTITSLVLAVHLPRRIIEPQKKR
jgi:Lrp/AsnC family leucine-responsive transcriptional regulator